MHILLVQFLLLVALAAFLYLAPIKKKIREIVFLVIAFAPLWYIHSMVEVGSVPDTYNYFFAYNYSINSTWKQCALGTGSYEGGYLLLNKLVGLVSSNYYVFQGIYGFVLIACYYYAYHKYSPYVIISVLLFLLGGYNPSIYIIREYLAIALMVASLPLIIERKLIPFLILIFCIFFIHQSSIVVLPLYFLYAIKNKRILLYLLIFSIIAIVGADYFISLISSMEDRYSGYLDDENYQNWKGAVIAIFEWGLFFYVMKDTVWEMGINKLLFIMMTIYMIFQIVSIGRMSILHRVCAYYAVSIPFVVPIMIKKAESPLLKVGIVLIFGSLSLYTTFGGNYGLSAFADMRLL